jgi:hypothetical protein
MQLVYAYHVPPGPQQQQYVYQQQPVYVQSPHQATPQQLSQQQGVETQQMTQPIAIQQFTQPVSPNNAISYSPSGRV